MSGIYIPGMEMPKGCIGCPLCVYCTQPTTLADESPLSTIELVCFKTKKNVGGGMNRHKDCPLVSVPDHGRLVDADALLENMKKVHDKWKMGEHYTPTSDDEIMVMYMPTIIPADKEG